MTHHHPIRTMFNSLANANFGDPLGAAYTTVVAGIDWGALDIEIMGRVVIGLVSLPEALRDAADVVDDADPDSDEGEGAVSAAEMLRAASVLDGLNIDSPPADSRAWELTQRMREAAEESPK